MHHLQVLKNFRTSARNSGHGINFRTFPDNFYNFRNFRTMPRRAERKVVETSYLVKKNPQWNRQHLFCVERSKVKVTGTHRNFKSAAPDFYHCTTLCISTVFAVAQCPSVLHVYVLYPDG